jgi:hypothetical protein
MSIIHFHELLLNLMTCTTEVCTTAVFVAFVFAHSARLIRDFVRKRGGKP